MDGWIEATVHLYVGRNMKTEANGKRVDLCYAVTYSTDLEIVADR